MKLNIFHLLFLLHVTACSESISIGRSAGCSPDPVGRRRCPRAETPGPGPPVPALNQLFISATEEASNLRFQAAEIQAKKVENQILNDIKFNKKKKTITLRINQVAGKSFLYAYTLDGLRSKLGPKVSRELVHPTKSEIETEIRYLSSSTQYQVFLQNVEHLSFMLETSVVKKNMRFYTSSSKFR